MSESSDACIDGPGDLYDPDDAMHVDEFPPYNGDRHASFAFDDDGNRFRVSCGDRIPLTQFLHERFWREVVLPQRDGVGKRCAGCGECIEWNAIIVNGEYHLRCYPGGDS